MSEENLDETKEIPHPGRVLPDPIQHKDFQELFRKFMAGEKVELDYALLGQLISTIGHLGRDFKELNKHRALLLDTIKGMLWQNRVLRCKIPAHSVEAVRKSTLDMNSTMNGIELVLQEPPPERPILLDGAGLPMPFSGGGRN